MATKLVIETVGEGACFILKRTNAETGKVSDAETLHSEKPIDDQAIGKVLFADFKAAPSRRIAWLSMLAQVFKNPKLDGYKGKGNRKTGKLAKEIKAAIREAEGEYLRGLVKAGHVKLKAGDNPEQVFQEFATAIREDKNYSNAKNHVTRYFAFVGAYNATQSGYLVPVPVMQEQVKAVLEVPDADNTVSGMLDAIKVAMDKSTIASDDAIDSLARAKALVITLEGIVQHYAEMRTAVGSGIGAAADAAVAKAKTAETEDALM